MNEYPKYPFLWILQYSNVRASISPNDTANHSLKEEVENFQFELGSHNKRVCDFLPKWLIAEIITSLSHLSVRVLVCHNLHLHFTFPSEISASRNAQVFLLTSDLNSIRSVSLTLPWNRSFSKRLFIFTLHCAWAPFPPFDSDNLFFPPSSGFADKKKKKRVRSRNLGEKESLRQRAFLDFPTWKPFMIHISPLWKQVKPSDCFPEINSFWIARDCGFRYKLKK